MCAMNSIVKARRMASVQADRPWMRMNIETAALPMVARRVRASSRRCASVACAARRPVSAGVVASATVPAAPSGELAISARMR
jgi:hypothetical protein